MRTECAPRMLNPYKQYNPPMSVRQIRFSSLEQIQKRLKDFAGKKINIVLCNRTVLFGWLKSVDQENLSFVNMREALVSLPLNEITEVYLDINE